MVKKIRLFSATNIKKLQQLINTWLAGRKNIEIIETNLTTVVKPPQIPGAEEELYTFYILYSITNHKARQTKQLAEESNPDVVEAEVKEELLKPLG